MSAVIYKICPESLWRAAEIVGQFDGAPVDRTDGYIHFSTASQVRETARRHFAGEDGLLLIAVDPAPLGKSLRWEASRNREPFPHLYGPLPLDAVMSVEPLPCGDEGHVFPAGIP